jgi:SHS2 domain-containing protein
MATRHGTISHPADLGLWVEADGKEELFAAAATALAELMIKGPRNGEIQWLPLDLEGPDLAGLLVALLNEVVFCLDAEGLLTVALKISELKETRLTARLGVIPMDAKAHTPAEPVKAVTYHKARVEPHGQAWRASVIMDV